MMKAKRSEIEESIMTRMMVIRCRTSGSSHDDNSNREKTLLDLPYHILELIVKRLYFIEQINFRAVCKSFRFMDKFQPRNQSPWILTFRVLESKTSCMLKDTKFKNTYTFVDKNIKEKELYHRYVVHDSKCGWVLMSTPALRRTCYSFVMYAPLLVGQNKIFELPLLYSKFRIAAFSSNPSQEDCIFIALNSNHNGFVSISTCRRGDSAWRTQHFESDFPLHELNHVVYFRGIFYCPINLHGGIVGTYNVAEQNWVVLEPERSTVQTSYTPVAPFHIHLVKTDNDGELRLVLMEILRGGDCFPFIPWSFIPGSIVPSYDLPWRLQVL